MTQFAPLTYVAESLHKYETNSAISSQLANRFCRYFSNNCDGSITPVAIRLFVTCVLIAAGQIALTRIPQGLISTAIVRVIVVRAPLVPAYATRLAFPASAFTEPMFTITGSEGRSFATEICFSIACARKNGAR